MITRAEVEKLALLSRIELSELEKETFRKEMESILGYVEEIKNVSSTMESVPKSAHRNIFRDDVYPHETGIFTEVLVREMPQHEGDYLKVKKIM